MKGGKLEETYNGWNIFSRTTPDDPKIKMKTYFHATNSKWPESKNKFHLWDHNPAVSLEEIKDAIDYWNQGGN